MIKIRRQELIMPSIHYLHLANQAKHSQEAPSGLAFICRSLDRFCESDSVPSVSYAQQNIDTPTHLWSLFSFAGGIAK